MFSVFAGLLLTTAAHPDWERVAVPNAQFEHMQTPKPGKYACCFSKWIFATRAGACELSAVKREDGTTAARIECTDGPARADLLGPFLKLPAFTEFLVEVDVRTQGATGVVALHPPFDRRQVDLALVTGTAGQWRRFSGTLRTGAAAKHYRVTLAAAGEGWVEFDGLSLRQVGLAPRPSRVAYIVDINEREKGYVPGDKFWLKHALETVWRYRVVVDHYPKATRDRLKELDPACVILTPRFVKEYPPGDRAARRAAHRQVSQTIADTGVPVLGICLGHQWLSVRAGQRLRRGEERGYLDLKAAAADPILVGLPLTFPLSQSHGWTVPKLPKGYELLASSAACPVQIMRRTNHFVYGIQAHPERGWTGPHPHGRVLLGNFFRMVEEYWRRRDAGTSARSVSSPPR